VLTDNGIRAWNQRVDRFDAIDGPALANVPRGQPIKECNHF
jgi:hypothetical protein